MNIFVLDKNPKRAAQMLCDKHISKMILESAQMLCTCNNEKGNIAPYKSTHKNHPCSKWVMSSLGNYNWLLNHSLEICKEFNRRYKKIHKSCNVIKWCEKNKPNFKINKRTAFVQAMPKEYKQKNAVKAYREYYLHEKLRFCKWRCSKKPKFVIEYEKQKKKN